MATVRESVGMLATIETTVGTSTTIDLQRFTGASLQLPSGSGTTEITVYAQLGANAWGIAQSFAGVDLVFAPAVLKPRPLPEEIWLYSQIRLVASAGTATADVPIYLT